MTVYPTLIAPLFNKFTKLEEGEIYQAVEALAKRVNFPLTQIFLVDGSKRSAHSNAYFYGFFKNKRIVLFDTLIKQVTQNELLAILGHEIGHWALWHTAQGFVITQLYIFALFLTFSYVQNTPSLFSAFGFTYDLPMPVFIGLMLFSQTFWSPVDKLLTFLMNINSRTNEFAADRYAAKLGMGADLCEGLVKISAEVNRGTPCLIMLTPLIESWQYGPRYALLDVSLQPPSARRTPASHSQILQHRQEKRLILSGIK